MRVRTLRVSLEEQFVYLGLENGDVYVVAVKMYLCLLSNRGDGNVILFKQSINVKNDVIVIIKRGKLVVVHSVDGIIVVHPKIGTRNEFRKVLQEVLKGLRTPVADLGHPDLLQVHARCLPILPLHVSVVVKGE